MTQTVTTTPIGSGETELVYLDGRVVGAITDNMASMGGSIDGLLHRFVDRDAAIRACVSYATRGYWQGEL